MATNFGTNNSYKWIVVKDNNMITVFNGFFRCQRMKQNISNTEEIEDIHGGSKK